MPISKDVISTYTKIIKSLINCACMDVSPIKEKSPKQCIMQYIITKRSDINAKIAKLRKGCVAQNS